MEMGSCLQYYDITTNFILRLIPQSRVRYALSKLDEGGVSGICNIYIKEFFTSTCPVKLNFFT
jgi:hypothetical protein